MDESPEQHHEKNIDISDYWKSERKDYSGISRNLVLEQTSYMGDVARSNANRLEDSDNKSAYNYWAAFTDILQEFNENINTGYSLPKEVVNSRMAGMIDAFAIIIKRIDTGDFKTMISDPNLDDDYRGKSDLQKIISMLENIVIKNDWDAHIGPGTGDYAFGDIRIPAKEVPGFIELLRKINNPLKMSKM